MLHASSGVRACRLTGWNEEAQLPLMNVFSCSSVTYDNVFLRLSPGPCNTQ